ncbi:MAG: SMC-Scp complex subunit ScpB [Fusobacterium perfoetens]|uniref:SMC-Scp complex subunit ScpB n=1 Tax=Fusobacterium perfoetens TaxID=852 RepID=UPI0023F242C1|nr:SMC-Scp complex subunit ScpB [Fusobacterium perfoetens]MCI6153262.1 SMC-Scp complex subunit ScpB [Fusobacterium perfoetens]MDY3238363.1 SMC-Scp complex subunit ScpB [Fusobacterium perfoetens]
MENFLINVDELKNKIEAILFIGGEDIKIKDISKFFGIPVDKLIPIIYELKGERKSSGINIEISDSNIYLVSNPKYGGVINNFFEQEKKPKKLSAATLETLSIIAYNQPITKSEIESIRGVNVDSIIGNLESRKFIRICGKKETVGRPNLYEVTEKFLGYLGIDYVNELPNYQEIREQIEKLSYSENKGNE